MDAFLISLGLVTLAGRLPVQAIRIVAAVSMAALGVWTIVSA